MSRSFERTLKSVKKQLLDKGKPEPDFTGAKPEDILLWHARNGTFEEVVARAMPSEEEEQNKQAEYRALERERQATEADRPTASVEAKPTPEPDAEPPAVEPPAVEPPPEPGMLKPEPQWWEERAHWRQRGPRDYEWEKPQLGRCLVEYDVLKLDNGYDPFGRDD